MIGEADLYSVSRVSNGWVVRVVDMYTTKAILCSTWAEVEKACRDAAFPYVDKAEPRGPR